MTPKPCALSATLAILFDGLSDREIAGAIVIALGGGGGPGVTRLGKLSMDINAIEQDIYEERISHEP
jgi:hypothetical protein